MDCSTYRNARSRVLPCQVDRPTRGLARMSHGRAHVAGMCVFPAPLCCQPAIMACVLAEVFRGRGVGGNVGFAGPGSG